MDKGYAHVWEFRVSPEHELEFRRHYDPAGTWAQLFRQSPDFIETLLLWDETRPGRYLTVDRWRNKACYLAFRSAFAVQYAQIDKACERLTVSELSMGVFIELPAGATTGP